MRRMLKKSMFVVLAMLLMLSLMLTGCKAKEPTAEELLTNCMTAMEKVTSYKIDYDMAMDMDAASGGDTQTMTMNGSGTGVMNVLKKEMQMTMDIEMEIPDYGTQQMSMEMYLVEGWIYTKIDALGTGEQWVKMEASDELSQDQAAQLTELMKSSTSCTIKGTEKVDGIDCYILEIVPDMAALMDWMMSQQGSDFTGGVDLSQLDLSKILKISELKYWIAKNNYRYIKAEAEMEMDMDAEDIGALAEEGDNMSMTMNMNMSFSDYNKTVNIELPEEALDAEEVSALY